MIRLEWYKFEISLDKTKEIKELELLFLVDGILMDEDRMIDRIKTKLEKTVSKKTSVILINMIPI